MKENILIIFGGASSEHEVSCKSAATIIRKINKEEYNPIKLGITKEGSWYLTEANEEKIASGEWEKDKTNKSAIISPERNNKGIIIDGNKKIAIQCAFPIIHGKFGEDGSLQGLLEIAGIPYVGSGVLASAAGMDKVVTKMFADKIGVKQAKYYAFNRYDVIEKTGTLLKDIELHFDKQYPLFVKPANAGSSVGISKVNDVYELFDGIKKAACEDHKIIVEEAIIGRELEVAVLGNRKPIASKVGEIVAAHDFYDYEAKYIVETNQTRFADDLSEEIVEELRANSIRIYKALDCSGLSRVDFFLEENTNEVIFNEINTLPGFTAISMYPKLWEKEGIEIEDLISRLIELALDKHEAE